MLLAVGISGAYSQSSVEEQLKLRFDENYLTQLQVKNPNLYNSYISELKCSFEFVNLKPDLKYPELLGYNYLTKENVAVTYTTVENFSLYNYKFVRYKDKDIVYKIPGSNQGILIYSKDKFESKL
jgi:hypothetical protein